MAKNKNITVTDLTEHLPATKTPYPNDFIDFLGGKEALNKIDIYGHRIIFCIMEMLKSVQVFSPKFNETLKMIEDEMIIDLEKGRISTKATVLKEEVEKRRKLEIGNKLAIIEEKYFANNFNMLQFVIPTRALNDGGSIKVESNTVFHNQLKMFRTIGLHEIISGNGKEKMMTSLIDNPIYEVGQSYIRFYMSKQVAEMLINNSNGYAEVYRNIIFQIKSVDPLNFYLFLKRKFGKFNGGTIKIEKLVLEMQMPDHCLTPSRMKTYLDSIKNNLDKHNNISFGYKIEQKEITFSLLETPLIIDDINITSDDYRLKNALKYIKKTRKLSASEYDLIKKIFDKNTYEQLQQITKINKSKNITGTEYAKWFMNECVKVNLL